MRKTTDAGVSAEARAEAHDVLTQYCKAIDEHDAEGLSSILADDALLSVGDQRWLGRENVVTFLSSLFANREWSRHFVTNVLVAQDGEGVLRVSAYFQFALASDINTLGFGDYTAVMQRRSDALLLTSLSVKILESFVVARETNPST